MRLLCRKIKTTALIKLSSSRTIKTHSLFLLGFLMGSANIYTCSSPTFKLMEKHQTTIESLILSLWVNRSS